MKTTTTASIACLACITAIAAAWPFRPVHEPQTTPTPDATTAVRHTLTLEGANRVLAAAITDAKARGAHGAIAVVDEGGSLIAFQRIDDTFAAGAGVSIGKARSAALFRKPTKAFEDSINGGRIALAAVEGLTPLQGGIPIVHDGFIIGAIGVSGAHTQAEDEAIAMAGASALSTVASSKAVDR